MKRMFDSIPDWIILIVVVAVLFGGASRIPSFAKSLGRAAGEFKKGQAEVEREIRQMNASESMPNPPVTQETPNQDSGLAKPENELNSLRKKESSS